MNFAGRLILSSSLLALGACATAPSPASVAVPAVVETPAAPAAPQVSAHERLFQLFKESDEANLRRNPLQALFRGDLRYAEHFGDFITDEYYAGERAAAEHDLAALHAISR